MNKNKVRTDIRRSSKFSEQVLTSQQTCALSENETILSTRIDSLEGHVNKIAEKFSPTETNVNNLKGLRAIFQILMANIDCNDRTTRCSYMDFEEAFAMFLSFHPSKTTGSLKNHEEKKAFKELLCHPNYGLAVYIILNKFIVLKSSETDLEYFMEDCLKLQETKAESRLDITRETLHDVLDSMDTAWDKKVLKVMLGVYFNTLNCALKIDSAVTVTFFL